MSQIIVLIVLIALNAFFAATEMSFISLNDAKIDMMVKDGNKKAKRIQKMLKNPSKFLATIQIGITLAGFLSSAFASDTFADDLAPILYSALPFLSLETWRSISMVLITMILSYFTLVFGELVPKRVAMKYYEKIAFSSIGVVRSIAFFTAPFVKLLTASTNIVSKLLGAGKVDNETVTEEEIRMMVDVGQEKGTINADEKEMINNVFEFNDNVVSEIMVHRTDIFAVDINSTIGEVINELAEDYRYSRVPVYDETIDEIKGVVYIKDILLGAKNKNTKIKSLVKEAYFVPKSKLINELFKDMRKNKKQIAIVIDEYGGTAGLVTMEDILEEIVGDIFDEYDEVEPSYEKIDENTYILDGSMAIYDVNKVLDIEIPEGEYDTLSGYLLEELGRIPKESERPLIETEQVTYKIEVYEDMRIEKVKACKHIVEEPEEDDDDDKDEEDDD